LRVYGSMCEYARKYDNMWEYVFNSVGKYLKLRENLLKHMKIYESMWEYQSKKEYLIISKIIWENNIVYNRIWDDIRVYEVIWDVRVHDNIEGFLRVNEIMGV